MRKTGRLIKNNNINKKEEMIHYHVMSDVESTLSHLN